MRRGGRWEPKTLETERSVALAQPDNNRKPPGKRKRERDTNRRSRDRPPLTQERKESAWATPDKPDAHERSKSRAGTQKLTTAHGKHANGQQLPCHQPGPSADEAELL